MTEAPQQEGTTMSEADPVLARIGEGIALNQQGDRAGARALFAEVWGELGADGDPLHRCALAHSMADVQDDPHEELAWDERALEAAEATTDERAAEAGMAFPVRAFYPSLHLNLGDVHHRLGHRDEALRHLGLGRAAVGALGDDGYGAMIRDGLDRLAGRIG
jgi:hypothetical protein